MANSNLSTYDFHKSNIRVITSENGEILFCLKDVCSTLQLSNINHVINQLKEEFEGGTLNVTPFKTQGGIQNVTFITEPQLYFVMMRSNSKIAREFRQWICNEVLPSIRKNGSFNLKKELESIKPYNTWFITEITDQCIKYGLDESAMSSFCNIVSRAYNQGYMIAIHSIKASDLPKDYVTFTESEAEAVEFLVHYHQLFRPGLLKTYELLRKIEVQADELKQQLREIPIGKIFDAATAADISVQKLKRFNTVKIHKNELVTRS
jgi:prophage antirepressor-like protein